MPETRNLCAQEQDPDPGGCEVERVHGCGRRGESRHPVYRHRQLHRDHQQPVRHRLHRQRQLHRRGVQALLQAGANAYLEKPVNMNVCVAQAEALMKLYCESNHDYQKCCPLTFGTELIISPLYRQIFIDGEPIELTRTEFDLLFCLAQHPGQVWSRSQLYSYVWEDDLGVSGDNTVRAHIGNLRKKLADAGKNYIQNIRGVGYRFIPPALNKKD